ncbi:MAG: GTP-dependent dephospho-CoA kinase family protein [Asgard group archaeon]
MVAEKNFKILYKLPKSLRSELKAPLGRLIKAGIYQSIREELSKEKNSRLITVGDVSTETLVKANIIPHVAIVDNKVGRIPRNKEVEVPGSITIDAQNPAATITEEAWKAIKNALESKNQPVKVVIKGEEDLLVIPAVIEAPINTLICYGQPDEGVVLIRVTESVKDKFQKILNQMQTE